MRAGVLCAGGLAALLLTGGLAANAPASAAELKGGHLRVALLADVNSFDPMAFSSVNFPVIKNLYDSLLEYSPEGKALPSLASAWKIGQGNTSVTLTLRDDVTFSTGTKLTAEAVAATLKKGADPKEGKNVYATMAVVKDWVVENPQTITVNFKNPVPERVITDLLQFLSVIDPSAIANSDVKPLGSGPFTLAERVLGQRIRLAANPKYWRAKEPIVSDIVFTVFSDNDAASAALESGAVDIIYGGGARAAARLRDAGYQLVQGPGQLVQVFRINSRMGPFQNAKYRQAFNYLMDRAAILRVGYAGLGQVTALPWAPSSPALDPSYDKTYAFNLDKAKDLLKESGLSAAQMSDWKLLVNGTDQDSVNISQVVQGTLAKVGINIQLELKQGSEYIDALLGGKFAATFGGVGNVQKFPTRLATNSIYRTANNPVLGEPHPFPAYVAAIDRINRTVGSEAEMKSAYDNLNKVLVESAFGIATNTYDVGLLVAAKNVGGITREIDNMLVGRTIGFTN